MVPVSVRRDFLQECLSWASDLNFRTSGQISLSFERRRQGRWPDFIATLAWRGKPFAAIEPLPPVEFGKETKTLAVIIHGVGTPSYEEREEYLLDNSAVLRRLGKLLAYRVREFKCEIADLEELFGKVGASDKQPTA
ncbi:MAG: hypothetical protein HYT42_00680 [Candidatus Sungbacteria bacterium]|nr:hypothetical protein [Candidatus Sungbacteria bacterium]